MLAGINAYMFHGLNLDTICRLTAQSGCKQLSIEVEQLMDPNLPALMRRYGLKLNSAGALFLNVDRQAESLTRALEVIASCATVGVPLLNIVIQTDRPDSSWISKAVRLFSELCAQADVAGVHLALEPLSPKMQNVSCMTQLAAFAQLQKQPGCESLRLTADICHISDMADCILWLNRLKGQIALVHYSDSDANGNRCLPGQGVINPLKWLRHLEKLGFDGTIELELISNTVFQLSEIQQISLIRESFLRVTRPLIVGELAIHRLLGLNQLGGNAGMIASQMDALGGAPYLLGICGGDEWGNSLDAILHHCSFPSRLHREDASRTSRVLLGSNAPTICAGTVHPNALLSTLEEQDDCPRYVYLPAYPSYDKLLDAADRKHEWKKIIDFGYYLWSGKKDVIVKRIAQSRGGFIALINGHGLTTSEKHQVSGCALGRGFRYVIVTDGADAILLFSENDYQEFPTICVDHVQDSCGAGDCLIAGLLYALCCGKSIFEALDYAIYVAWHKVQTWGIWCPPISKGKETNICHE